MPTGASSFRRRPSNLRPGFGENISTEGLTEHNVFMGDIFRWGEALISHPAALAVLQAHYHFAIEDISVLMQQSGRCGWLYRVVSGAVSGDRPLALAARNSDVSVAEAIAIARHMPFDAEQYRRLLAVAGLRQLEQDHAHAARRRAA